MERTHLNRSAAGIPSPSRPPVAAPIGLICSPWNWPIY